jgi:hypothetical protein
VGSSGQSFKLFLRQLGIGNRQELLIDLCLPAEVAIAQNPVRERRNLASMGACKRTSREQKTNRFANEPSLP